MALTRSFKETVKSRVQRDKKFRVALFQEAAEPFLRGEIELGKTLLRDFVNATIGFSELAESLGKSPKSLMRMLSASGNPRAEILFAILAHLQESEGVELCVTSERAG